MYNNIPITLNLDELKRHIEHWSTSQEQPKQMGNTDWFWFSNTVTELGPNSIHCTLGDNSGCAMLEFLPSFANKRNIMHICSIVISQNDYILLKQSYICKTISLYVTYVSTRKSTPYMFIPCCINCAWVVRYPINNSPMSTFINCASLVNFPFINFPLLL